jgi:hypothetical protein
MSLPVPNLTDRQLAFASRPAFQNLPNHQQACLMSEAAGKLLEHRDKLSREYYELDSWVATNRDIRNKTLGTNQADKAHKEVLAAHARMYDEHGVVQATNHVLDQLSELVRMDFRWIEVALK